MPDQARLQAAAHRSWFVTPDSQQHPLHQLGVERAMLPAQHVPLCSELILGGDAEARQFEWASIWCMFSLGQVRVAAAAAAVVRRRRSNTGSSRT
jgi:hypothetical protein